MMGLYMTMNDGMKFFMDKAMPLGSVALLAPFATIHIHLMQSLRHLGFNGTHEMSDYVDKISQYISFVTPIGPKALENRMSMIKYVALYTIDDTYNLDLTGTPCWTEE